MSDPAKTTVFSRARLSGKQETVTERLQVDGPTEFREFFLNIGQCVGECGAPMRASGALG